MTEIKSNQQLTKRQARLINTAVEISLTPTTAKDAKFLARQFVQVTLPHRDPKTHVWYRTNGNTALGIQAGFNFRTGESYGLPYGVIPRLLLFWITTEAVRTKKSRLELGDSLAAFMRQVGLDPSRGGKRSDAHRLHEQMRRLFSATVTFCLPLDDKAGYGQEEFDIKISNHRVFWWSAKQPEQGALWKSYIDLTPEFYSAITAAPIPVHTEALKELKNSPLALDLYALCCYEAYRAEKNGKARFIPWRALSEQLGANYNRQDKNDGVKDFARNCRLALKKIQPLMPTLHFTDKNGGLTILSTSSPAISHK